MKIIKAEKTEKSMYQLEISVEKEVFEDACNKVYRKQVKNINVPGFRKGKAPRSIIEKMYGKGVFYEDAINDILPSVYTDAIKEADIKDIVSQPEFDIVSIDDNGLVLSANVYVKPDVEISDYVGIAVEKKVEPVSDDEVNAEINKIRERYAREIEISDRAAELDDVAKIDYEGFCDGVAFEGGKGEDHPLKLGSGQFIPGFEEQIVGHKVGEKFDINVEFPAEYHSADLAGKAAVFKINLKSLTKSELPELDDEFAKDVSEFNTFAEYKADLVSKIEKRHQANADTEVENALVDALVEKLVADIPEPMFVNETENFIRDYDNNLRMSGLDLKTFLGYTGGTLEKLREEFRPRAEKQVKARLALEKIAILEGLEASSEDIDGEYSRIAEAYGMTVEQVKENIESSAIAEDMRVKKAMDFVKEKAAIGAPKKTAAKKTTSTSTTPPKKTTSTAAKKPATTAAKKTTTTAAKKATTTKKEAPAKKKTEAPKGAE